MAQNFLYTFEFVVDDLLVTRPNHCAPEEYPTCCEISFRSSVFVSICDREFGQCVDPCAPKCGKCCLFSLESPVTEKDRLLIHIYKKKNDMCKFLVGATELPIKSIFDKVTESFNIENPNWMDTVKKHTSNLPDPKMPSKSVVVYPDCDEEPNNRREQLCPTSELTKRLLPLFNIKGRQTGNLVFIMRLVCNGPTIVSSFPFTKVNNIPSDPKNQKPHTSCQSYSPLECQSPSRPCPYPHPACPNHDPCSKETHKSPCRRYFTNNAEKGCACDECEDDIDRGYPIGTKPNKKIISGCRNQQEQKQCSNCYQRNPCQKIEQKVNMCQRYFTNGADNTRCPCEECIDECEADECCSEACVESPEPCFIIPSKPIPGPEAYDEFEACLNGSGVVIRVLKETHQMQAIEDGESVELGSECQFNGIFGCNKTNNIYVKGAAGCKNYLRKNIMDDNSNKFNTNFMVSDCQLDEKKIHSHGTTNNCLLKDRNGKSVTSYCYMPSNSEDISNSSLPCECRQLSGSNALPHFQVGKNGRSNGGNNGNNAYCASSNINRGNSMNSCIGNSESVDKINTEVYRRTCDRTRSASNVTLNGSYEDMKRKKITFRRNSSKREFGSNNSKNSKNFKSRLSGGNGCNIGIDDKLSRNRPKNFANDCGNVNEKQFIYSNGASSETSEECFQINDFIQNTRFARDYVTRHTCGKITNNLKLPQIRANIKYAGNDLSEDIEKYHLPLANMKQYCDNHENKLDMYRRSQGKQRYKTNMPLQPGGKTRNCCLQVEPKDLENMLNGINADARKKGIEVCYKTCENTDSDIFFIKLGSKQACKAKMNSIEIELKTPKQNYPMPIQKVTTETQITEIELDREIANRCGKRTSKSKKARKAKGKK